MVRLSAAGCQRGCCCGPPSVSVSPHHDTVPPRHARSGALLVRGDLRRPTATWTGGRDSRAGARRRRQGGNSGRRRKVRREDDGDDDVPTAQGFEPGVPLRCRKYRGQGRGHRPCFYDTQLYNNETYQITYLIGIHTPFLCFTYLPGLSTLVERAPPRRGWPTGGSGSADVRETMDKASLPFPL